MRISVPGAVKSNISLLAFFVCVTIHLAITLFVIAAIYRDNVELTVPFYPFGITISSVLYLLPIAVLTYIAQHKLSEARGIARFFDFLISLPMLVATALALPLWTGIPFVEDLVREIGSWVRDEPSTTPTGYKFAVVVIFGALALADVLGRDVLGWFRRSRRPATVTVAPEIVERRVRERVVVEEEGEVVIDDVTIPVRFGPEHRRWIADQFIGLRLPGPRRIEHDPLSDTPAPPPSGT